MQHAKHLRVGRAWPGAWRLAAAVLLVAGGLADGASAAGAKKPPAKDAKAAADDAAPQRDTVAIQRAYAAGTKAFETGDMAEAERQLTVAISGGGLPNSQMARALYYRGAASRQLGRPARAISDLTTAVWLKGGLEGDDRKKAIEARQLAYQEAGLGDKPPPVGGAPLDQAAGTPAAATPAKPGTLVAVVPPKGSSFWGLSAPTLPKLPSLASLTGSAQPAATPAAAPAGDAAAATPPAAGQPPAADPAQAFSAPAVVTPAEAEGAPPTQPQPGPVTAEAAPAVQSPAPPPSQTHSAPASWDTQTAAAGSGPDDAQKATLIAGYAPIAEGPASPPPAMGMTEQAPSAAPQGSSWNPFAGTGEAISGTGKKISGFFSNMFASSGGGAAAPAGGEATAVTTGSTAGLSGWGSETHTAQTSSMVQRGPDAPAADALPWTATQSSPGASTAPAQRPPAAAAIPKKVASAGAADGRFKLQVAAVRSREEAERLAQSLQGYPAVRDGIVTAQIDEAVIGSMGTFYRVRLGPYGDASEPGQLCKTLRPQGFDCLVVTQ
jgi:hypothetical protein